ncbi:hypothetical protein [Methylorubrum extorquens]|uniref:Uncharacterized protein n=1 Tax=Methylorubrum extorquens (strain CM4 / NCIMB 13688) TaxID=440085 RepID=B7KTG4_METC4|nr:hypothetical protein [Methylorubrum extorquens]ACK82491.1 hypothetical protein Mchl_1627 [Methylorubrum extorquens CM4]
MDGDEPERRHAQDEEYTAKIIKLMDHKNVEVTLNVGEIIFLLRSIGTCQTSIIAAVGAAMSVGHQTEMIENIKVAREYINISIGHSNSLLHSIADRVLKDAE